MATPILLLVLVSGIVPSKAAAMPAAVCDCSQPTMPRSYELADVVVRGRVIGIVLDAASGWLRVDVEVAETFKQPRLGPHSFYTDTFGVTCEGYDFRVGREYVIFADVPAKLSTGRKVSLAGVIVTLCGGTSEMNRDGVEALAALRKLMRRKLLPWS